MQIGSYEVLEEVARGGFGVVYRALDVRGLEVAIKVLLDARDEVELARFMREGEATIGLEHPNLVRVHGMGHAQGRPYLVMDFVTGPTLAQRLKREGRLPLAEARQVKASR